MKKFFKIMGVVLLLVVFVGTIVFLYNKSKKQPELYENRNPFYSDVVRKTVATGSVVPRQEIEIKPQISGIIDEIYVEAGDRVEKDQVIARIKIIPDMVSLNTAESRLKQADINLQDARIDFERQKKLYDADVISFEEFKAAKVAYEQAQEEHSAADNNLELIRNGVTKKAQNATNTLVRSTITGMVLDVPVKVGNSVIQSNTFNDGTTIAVVADMQDMIFEGKVDETEVGKIHEGMPIELEIGAIEKDRFDAVLAYISPKGEEENGAIQFEIKADVSLKSGRFIRSGYSANANIVLERKDSALVIPEGMLRFKNDSAFVEVLTDEAEGIYEKRSVKTGISDGIHIEIVEGLSLTDQVKGDRIDPKKIQNKEG
ncbi:MAG: efflux RND transporter periplasmic adaptor subunit [Mangrovibacterium sp.]